MDAANDDVEAALARLEETVQAALSTPKPDVDNAADGDLGDTQQDTAAADTTDTAAATDTDVLSGDTVDTEPARNGDDAEISAVDNA